MKYIIFYILAKAVKGDWYNIKINSKIKNRTVLSLDFGSHEIKGVYGKVENNKVLVNSIFKGSVENSWYRDGRVENMDAAKNNMINILKKNKIPPDM